MLRSWPADRWRAERPKAAPPAGARRADAAGGAFAAALADEGLDREAALAFVVDPQAVLGANTAVLMAGARGAGGYRGDVGQAMGGITKQPAAKKHRVLAGSEKSPSASG